MTKVESKGGNPANGEILCERCGYVLDATPRDAMCPECGKRVGESLPERRVGSAWQRRPGPRAWFSTAILMHSHPGKVWETLRTSSGDARLLVLSATLAAIPVGLWVGWRVLKLSWQDQKMKPGEWVIFTCLSGIGAWVLFALLLVGLTLIEARGVVFFSGKRGWRVGRELSRAVCAHAACTWWLASTGVLVGVECTPWIDSAMTARLPASWTVALPPAWAIGPLVGFTLCMLAFETLVYQGVRACRFANVPAVGRAGLKRDGD